MGLDINFDKLSKRLSEMAKIASEEAINNALDAGDKELIEEMKEEVPKDTFELHDSLGEIKRIGKGIKRTSTVGIKSKSREVIERGYHQEHGNKRMMGKKWMKRAMKNSRKRVIEKMEESLKKDLKR